MYIMKLNPVFKDYIWGGTKLKTKYNKLSDLDTIAESWELSCHPNGKSTIANGMLAGKTIDAVINDNITDILGYKCKNMTGFPLLIKLIDAQTNLSIQVHPDDLFAYNHENDTGKAEVWIVLDCDEGAYIYYGLNRKLSRDELLESAQNGTILNMLNKVYVKKGDVFYIKPGTIHAICSGIIIAEIQQNSDLTYRLYDYDRLDNEGKPRPLHLDNGIKCADLEPIAAHKPPGGYLVSNEYFSVKGLSITGYEIFYTGDDCFQALLITEGKGCIQHKDEQVEFLKGDCFFIPANMGEYTIHGNCQLLMSGV